MSIFTITATGNFRYSEDSCQNLLDCVACGHPGGDCPGHADGPHRPGVGGRGDGLPRGRRAGRADDGPNRRPGAPVLFGGAPAEFHMRAATSPMAAIEALHLDVAYVAVAKSLGLPTQAYMALSDGKQLGRPGRGGDVWQRPAGGAGGGQFGLRAGDAGLMCWCSACPKAGAGRRSVRPGAAFCAGDVAPVDDLPTLDLVRELMAEQHLITAPHTMAHWPDELYLPDRAIDRQNRENWEKAGSPTLERRVFDEVERRLAAYEPSETDKRVLAEMERLMVSGMVAKERPLTLIPPHVRQPAPPNQPRERRRTRRG
jgi:trimethylamine--corrinoid protein Co-methyltransferase